MLKLFHHAPLLIAVLTAVLHAPLLAAQQTTVDKERMEREKAQRSRSQELFEGRNDTRGLSPEQYAAHLSSMCVRATNAAADYGRLDRSVPRIASDQPHTPSLVPGSDFFMLFFQVAPPSEQKKNYYAMLPLRQDLEDPEGLSFQRRLENRILQSPGQLQPADVTRLALDAAHGNYPLAMLTAHNLLKEITEKGRDQVYMNTYARQQLPAGRAGLDITGIDQRFGDFASKLAPLRNSSNADKMGPWYHFFVPLTAEAWGSRLSALSMERAEHGARHVGLFPNDDPEKQAVDECALNSAYSIHKAFADRPEEADSGMEVVREHFAEKPDETGGIRVRVRDGLSRGGASIVDWMGEDSVVVSLTPVGSERHTVLNVRVDQTHNVPVGQYVVHVDLLEGSSAARRYTAPDEYDVEVVAGKTATVIVFLPSRRGRLDVAVRDEKGIPLEGIVVSIPGSDSAGPIPAPFYVDLEPGLYKVIVPQSTVKGKTYREKKMEADVVANQVTPAVLNLEPLSATALAKTISISAESPLTLNVNQSYELQATVYDDKGQTMADAVVQWGSSDPRIAAIDATGNITARSPGQAQLTATTGEASSVIVVRVAADRNASVDGCVILEHPSHFPVGRTFTFAAGVQGRDGKVTPGLPFRWSSSNEVVAPVDSKTGRMSPKKPGASTVYAQGKGWDGLETDCSAEITIDDSYEQVLVSGRVVDARGTPFAGAYVNVPGAVSSKTGANGEFAVMTGKGPYRAGSSITAEAVADVTAELDEGCRDKSCVKEPTNRKAKRVQGRASGVVARGLIDGLRIVLGASATTPSTGGLNIPPPEQIVTANRALKKHLICIASHPNACGKEQDKFFLAQMMYPGLAKPSSSCNPAAPDKACEVWVDLGYFEDVNGMCAVLRRYGLAFVAYEGYTGTGTSSAVPGVRCSKDAPIPGSQPPTTQIATAPPTTALPTTSQPRATQSTVGTPARAPQATSSSNRAPDSSADDRGPEYLSTLAMRALVVGDVSEEDIWTPEPRPLPQGATVKPGTSLSVGKNSSVTLKFADGSTAKVNEQSKVKLMKSPERPTAPRLEIEKGSVEVQHRPTEGTTRTEGPVSFDGLEVGSGNVTGRARGTHYRVAVTDKGVSFEVLEGWVIVTGPMLARTNANFEVVGKPSFPKQLDLKAGEYAFAFRGMQPAGDPSRLANEAPRSNPGGKNSSSPLDTPEPWNQPQVQQLIDEWLNSATPEAAARYPGNWRYNSWGQVLGPGITAAGAPDHPAGWSRYRSLWAKRSGFGSLNLCTLGVFVERRIAEQSLEDCKRGSRATANATQAGVPAWVSSGNTPARTATSTAAAPSTSVPDPIRQARQEIARDDQQRRNPSTQNLASNRATSTSPASTSAAPPVPAATTIRPLDISGHWRCTFENHVIRGGGSPPPQASQTIPIEVGWGNVVMPDEHGKGLKPAYVEGNRIGYSTSGEILGQNLTLKYDLELRGNVLVGTGKVEGANGLLVTQDVTCADHYHPRR